MFSQTFRWPLSHDFLSLGKGFFPRKSAQATDHNKNCSAASKNSNNFYMEKNLTNFFLLPVGGKDTNKAAAMQSDTFQDLN